MTWAGLFVAFVKILVAVLFLLNMAALTTWADRRQGAMVQDRVGPNRAVVFLPSLLVQLIIGGAAVVAGGLIATPFWGHAPGAELARMTQGVEIAVLVTWVSLLILCVHVRRHGADNPFDEWVASLDPRVFFYGGLVAHLITAIAVQLIPPGLSRGDKPWGPGLAGSLAAGAILSSGFYAAAKVPEGKVGIRLAGMLHAAADAVKLIWKEDLRPKNADKLLYMLAPLLAMFPALVTMAVIPMGSTMCFVDVDKNRALSFADLGSLAQVVDKTGLCGPDQVPVSLAIADLNVGLLYIFAIAGTGVIGAAIAGWASDNKWALLGGLRATSQMVSYEVALGLSIVGMLMITGAVHMQRIVDWQHQNAWGIFVQPAAFFLFLAALIAETKRVPFDQPEGESEIIAGYFLEYSGMKFGMFFTGEYAEFVFSSVLLVTMFFGGYHLPFVDPDGVRVAIGGSVLYELKLTHLAVTLIHVAAFFGKVIVMVWLQVFIRWTVPRFRYDQLMQLGWTRLLPFALLNILATGLVLLAVDAVGAGVRSALQFAAEISQALVALAIVLIGVAKVTWLLEPKEAKQVAESSTARRALETGGIKPKEMEA
jgi:NADH-quinone oxidoreductase subunit H